MERRKDGERRFAGPLLAAGVLLTGLLVTVLVAGGLRAAQRERAERVMDQRHAAALATVQTEIARYRALLEAVAAGAATHRELTWDEFDVASEPMADAGLLGATAAAYVVPVRTADIPAEQRRWRGLGAAALTLRAAEPADEHYFAVYARTLHEGDTPAVGTDLRNAPELTNVLAESRRIHATAVSDTYVLLSDRTMPAGRQQQSFVLATPIWSRANTPEFRGWMMLGLRGRDFLSGVLGTISQGQLLGRLIATDSDGSQVTVVDWSAPGDPDLTRSAPFTVGDRTWTLVTQADSARLPGARSQMPALVLVGGGLLTGLLSWLVHVLATGRARARAQVEVATAELRVAEEESRRQAGLLGAVLTSISDGVSVVDETGRVLVENPAGKRLMGTDEANDHPEQWQQHYGVFRPDGVTPMPVEEMPLIRALHGEPADQVEVVIRNQQRPEGVLISVDGRPLDPSAGLRGAVAVFRDITDLRRYETDLRVFAGVVAHDLKAPLALAHGHAEVALDDLPPESPTRERLLRIVGSIDRMDTMIETLLAYTTARNAPLRPVPLDVAALARQVIEERTAHRDDVTWSIGPLPPVQADPGMLRHLLDNLIGNALKYVRPGVAPHVVVDSSRLAPDGPGESGGWVRIEVADNGIGIPDAEKPHIFETFHRTEEAARYAGTGLGLAICRRIVERHGGEIDVTDNPGGGSRFFVTLPGVPADTVLEGRDMGSTAENDDAAVRAALERALAERAAILEAAQLPGLGMPQPAREQPLRMPRPEKQRQDQA
ncbi:ATP-binding protein [Actinoplanes sp. DH11]|uniref:ATP-binding protein n=1 Tax=Actinoplanes sp. DH11 TaxID=2857011 RepID=UPI001E45C3CB|nr:ATP-binding protein [Actinoplanes sp. DH11]